MLEIARKMHELIPDDESNRNARLAQAFIKFCSSRAPGSVDKREQAKKALAEMTRGLGNHLFDTAEKKGRTVELAEALLVIAPAIISGGKPPSISSDQPKA
jgi:hypothetical protein